MVRFISIALLAFAATRGVVLGVRLEPPSFSSTTTPWADHAVLWHEHKMLQEKLTNMLAEATAVEAGKEEPGDAQAQQSELRAVVTSIKKDWHSAEATVCHQQLGQLMDNLTSACEQLRPKADWLLDYAAPTLPNKTCAESVSDIFAFGSELVETLRISRHSVASLEVDAETLRRYQALSFLRSWLVDLTRTDHHALLWAGFWDGDPQKRTTMTDLFNFAKKIDHSTVHPDSFLGQAIEASQDLNACYGDPQTSALAGKMWSVVSMSFVLGMRAKAQGTVIALVNKKVRGERSLSQSVLFNHEVPTVGLAAWGLGYWSPQVLVLDLMGTCQETSPALQKQLFARLPSWAKSMIHWSPEAFATRSRLRWKCIDCSGHCSLDHSLAQHVQKLVEAREPF